MENKNIILNKNKENIQNLSSKAISPNNTSEYFRGLKQNLLKSTKNQNQKENNIEKNINIFKKIKLIKKEDLLKDIIDKDNSKKEISKNIYSRKKLLLRRNFSYTTKNYKKGKGNEKDILSCLNIFTNRRKKDFSRITSNINYLLQRNQTLLMREDNIIINDFNYFKPQYTNNLDKNIFKQNNFSSRNGMYGKKENLPLFYEISYTHRNDYSSKSEKNRHEILLNELSKLKFYLEQNPNDELLIIKDFLQKFHIKNISKYSDEKLLKICKFICKAKQNQLLKIIKPDSNLKKMIYNFLNLPIEKEDIYDNKYNAIYSPQNTFRKINLNKNKTFYNFRVNKRKNYFDIYDTNSKLKYLFNQKELYRPNKNYSQNLDLLINEISKEVKEIENNIKKSRDIDYKANENFLFITQTKSKSFSSKRMNNKKLILSPINRHNKESNKNGFFLIFSKNNLKNYNKNNNLNNKTLNICLRKKTMDVEKNNKKDKKHENEVEKNKINIKELVKRLYYAPTQKKFGLFDVKKNLKLTEYIALHFAKQKQKMNKIEIIKNPYIEKN